MIRMSDGFSGERSISLPDMIIRACENDGLLANLYITDIGFYPHAIYHYRKRQQGVTQYILIYCIKGSGWYHIRGKRHEVKENQYFIIPQGEAHEYASNNHDPWTIYWVHFTGHCACYFDDGSCSPTDILPGATSRISDRNTIFEDIFLTLSDNYNIYNLRYAASLLYGFLASFRYLSHFRKYNSQQQRINSSDIVNMSVRYMNENIEKKLRLDDLCRFIGYSPSQLSLLFRNQTGHSPHNYFNILKIQLACKLLETTDLKINQICAKVGIDDSYYFSRLFTKTIGISPKKYRCAKNEAK